MKLRQQPGIFQRVTGVILFGVLLLTPSVSAAPTGAILGTVFDATGGVIPDAEVTVTSVETGVVRAFRTNASGVYEVPQLPPGTYTVSAQKPGFKTQQVGGIVLEVDQRARVDLRMQVGAVSESVDVQATTPMVSPDSAAQGTVITNRRVVDLPLNGRNFVDLTLLIPGASQTNRSAGSGEGNQVAVNGVKAEYNNFTLDGVDNNVATVGSQAVNPSIDAIQEFKVQSGNYSAEYGRAGGAQVNVVTRSGTNDFHGAVFEFLRNNKIQARNFFDKADPGPYKQNQYGFSLGGPVFIPHVYDAKNHTFFFANYDGTKIRQAAPLQAYVPTATERSGDFSGEAAIFNPYTGQPLPDNKIPANMISPIASKLLTFWPLPNFAGTGTVNNYTSFPSRKTDVDQFTIRGDQYVGTKDQFFARLTWTDKDIYAPGVFDNFGASTTLDPDRNVGAGWTHIFTPTLLVEARFGYNARNTNVLQQNGGIDYAAQLGLPMISTDTADLAMPYFNVAPYTAFGDVAGLPKIRLDRSYQGNASLTLIRGRHSIMTGFEYRRTNLTNSVAQQRRGQYDFDSSLFSKNGLANLLLGLPSDTVISNPALVIENWYAEVNAFVQDDWRVNSRLTLNLGLRYSNMRPWQDLSTKESSFDPSTGKLVTLCSTGYPCGLYNPRNLNFAPRVGFAYDPFGKGKVVIRGGYGIFYVTEVANPVFDQGQNPPFGGYALAYNANALQPGGLTLDNPFPGALAAGAPTFPTLYVTDLNYRSPYVQQFSFGVQYQVGQNWLAEATYVGTRGTHILTTYDVNEPRPGPGPIQSRRPYGDFGVINYSTGQASSSYNGLQLKLERRFSAGFTLLGAYTFSKAIDNQGVAWSRPQDSQNLAAERGLSDFDVRQRFVASVLYEFPFGHGKHFGSGVSGLPGKLISGWEVTAIETAVSGQPYSPLLTYDVANVDTIQSGVGYAPRANRVGSGNIDNPTVTRWWDPAAFVAPAQYTFGNAGRNILIAPGRVNLDLSLIKLTNITERVTLEFRGEAFNALNQTQFGAPSTQVITPLFGVISSANAPRIFQFGLKLRF